MRFEIHGAGSFMACALKQQEQITFGMIGVDTLGGDHWLGAEDKIFIEKCVGLFQTTYEAIVAEKRRLYEEQKAYLASLAGDLVESDEVQV